MDLVCASFIGITAVTQGVKRPCTVFLFQEKKKKVIHGGQIISPPHILTENVG